MSQVEMYARLEDNVKQAKRAAGMSFKGKSLFKRRKKSAREHERQVRQRVHVVFQELIFKLLAKIRDKPYYKKPLPIGGKFGACDRL